jgi:hypothetical protein
MPPSDGWDRDERDVLEPIEDELMMLRARHANDPPLDLLRAANADALPPGLQSRVGDHLSQSAWSRALLAGVDAVDTPLGDEHVDRLLARMRKDARRADRPAWSGAWLWSTVLATSAAVAILAFSWASRHPAPMAQPVSTAPQTTVAENRPAVFQLPLEKPDVTLSVAALTWRGSSAGASLVDDLAPGLDAFRQSDYSGAARALAPLETRYPESVEAPFYRGVSLLFLNDPAAAIDALQKAERIADDMFAPDVAWYRAVAEQRAGRPADARARLDTLCRTTNTRTARACDAITQLDSTPR